jgi:hypothetical protein
MRNQHLEYDKHAQEHDKNNRQQGRLFLNRRKRFSEVIYIAASKADLCDQIDYVVDIFVCRPA